MTLFHTCCETLHRSGGGRMKVNERRTVVGGLIGHCVSPPTVERDRRACPAEWGGDRTQRYWFVAGSGCPDPVPKFITLQAWLIIYTAATQSSECSVLKTQNESPVVLQTKVLVSRCLQDKNSLGLDKKSREFQDFLLAITIKYFDSS